MLNQEMKELSPICAAILTLSGSLSASTNLPLATCGGGKNQDYRTTPSPCFTALVLHGKKNEAIFFEHFSFAVGHSIHLLWCSQSKQINKCSQIDSSAALSQLLSLSHPPFSTE